MLQRIDGSFGPRSNIESRTSVSRYHPEGVVPDRTHEGCGHVVALQVLHLRSWRCPSCIMFMVSCGM